MRTLVLACAVLLCSACHPATQATPTSSATVAAITPADLEKRLFIIAHDSMMGRETGSAGNYKTAEYVAAEFRRLGLEPAGENGTYFQTVPFYRVGVDRGSYINSGEASLALARDFLPTGVPVAPRSLDGVTAIYAGAINDTSHFISPDQGRGHVVVLDVPPGVSTRGTPINNQRWTGAAAVAIVALDQIAPEQLARVIEGRPTLNSTLSSTATPILFLSRRGATLVLGGAPASLSIGAVGPALKGRFGFTAAQVEFAARNVVAILPGRDPALRGEYVALTAHNDHVGFDHMPVDHDSVRAFDRVVRPMGADSPQREATAAEWARIRPILDSLRRANKPRLDSIRNGADDDGSGTVSILEIAEAMALAPERPRRSILFVNHVAEEAGLLGSGWYTDHATVPVDSIVAEIDQDMVGRGRPDDYPRPNGPPATPTYLEVVGDQKLSMEFASMLEAANAKQPVPFEFDRSYAAPGHPLQYYCRADHYNYARYGIPAVAFSRGEHLDYHQVTDEAQYISYPDLARVAKMVFDAAMLIGNADHRPKLDGAKPTNPHAPCRQ
jgi:hypothetical protein